MYLSGSRKLDNKARTESKFKTVSHLCYYKRKFTLNI